MSKKVEATETNRRAGLSVGHDTHEVHVPASKLTKEAQDKQQHVGVKSHNLAPSVLGEGGSHGLPDSKKNVGGTAGGSKNGHGFAEGNPKLSSKDVNEKQRNAQKENERLENGGGDTSKKDVYGRKK
jgi:hypothetical protein